MVAERAGPGWQHVQQPCVRAALRFSFGALSPGWGRLCVVSGTNGMARAVKRLCGIHTH
jgi:hypothetical protein